jgi:hypothetical protein
MRQADRCLGPSMDAGHKIATLLRRKTITLFFIVYRSYI